MKTIHDGADEIRRDIIRQTKREALYLQADAIFDGMEFPDETYIWVCEMYDNTIHVELSPNGEDKDFQPLIHKLCQKFSVKFEKQRDYDDQSLRYTAKFVAADETKVEMVVTGVVPKNCKLKETKVYLTSEQLEEERQKALDSVKLYRIERIIECVEPDEQS